MNLEQLFSIGSLGLVFGFIIAIVIGLLASIINTILKFIKY